MTPNDQDWLQHRQYIVRKLEEQSEELETIREQVTLLRIDFAMQKVRAGAWGAMAGAIPAGVAVLTVVLGGGG
jgi:ABC-type protease/lipase transport system fused ATPase/permease subunit